MTWKITGTWEGIPSWVAYDGKITTSLHFGEELMDQLKEDRAVLITPTGPLHEISGPLDERGAFLLGLGMLEDRTVTGDTPEFEIPPIPEDAVS